MNTYTKDLVIRLHTEFDKTQLSDVEKEFTNLSSIKFLDEKQLTPFKEAFVKMKEQLYAIEELKKSITEMEMFGGDAETLKALKTKLKDLEDDVGKKQNEAKKAKPEISLKDTFANFKQNFKSDMADTGNNLMRRYLGGTNMSSIIVNQLEKVATKIIDGIKSAINDAVDELKDMAGYNLAGSYTYNSSAWSTTMTYGTSSAQSYALDKTMERLGVKDDEELFEAMMSPNFREQWAEDIGYYTDKYNSLAQSDLLEDFQRFQLEFSRFKEEFTYKIMEWIVANKDVIMRFLNFSMQFMEVVMNLLGSIADWLLPTMERSDSEKTKTTLEILGQTSENKQARLETLANSSTYNSTSTTNNVNINSNINYPKADSKTLMDIPALMYKEVIDAINK